jgi:DNA-directed RNA polymerase
MDRFMSFENEEWERKMKTDAQEALQAKRVAAEAGGTESTVEPYMFALRGMTNHASEILEKRLAKKGQAAIGVALVRQAKVTGQQAAFIGARVVLDGITRGQRLQTVALAIGHQIEDERDTREFKKAAPKFYAVIEEDLKTRKSNSASHKSKVLRAARARANTEIPTLGWGKKERAEAGLLVLDALFQSGLIEKHSEGYNRATAQTLIQFTPAGRAAIESRDDLVKELCRPRRRPTLVAPRPWTSPFVGGYHHAETTLVKTDKREYLEGLRAADMPLVYDAVNAVQATPWQVNEDILVTIQELAKGNSELAKIPARRDPDRPMRPAGLPNRGEKAEDAETRRLVNEYKSVVKDWHSDLRRRQSHRMQFDRLLEAADELKSREEFYFPHQLDYRGRAYAMPLLLQPQGNDMARGLLRFAEGKPLGAMGGYWLAVHGANCMGKVKVDGEDVDLSKLPMNARVDWVVEHEAHLRAVYQNPLEGDAEYRIEGGPTPLEFWTDADDPWQFLAFCLEWAESDFGADPDYESHIPVSIDGSCNGLQHYSALLRDEACAEAVNLLPADVPEDLYERVAVEVRKRVEADVAGGQAEEEEALLAHMADALAVRALLWDASTSRVPLTDPKDLARVAKLVRSLEYRLGKLPTERLVARQWLAQGITRSVVKRQVMTTPYGSTKHGMTKMLKEELKKMNEAKALSFGTGEEQRAALWTASTYLTPHIYDAIGDVVVAARTAMGFLQDVAGALTGAGRPLMWTTPTGFPVLQELVNTRGFTVDTALMGRLQLRFVEDGDKLDPRKQKNSVAPNFVHSLGAAHLMATVVQTEREAGRALSWAMVHDSFGTHAADVELLGDVLRRTFRDLYEDRDPLGDLLAQAERSVPSASELPTLPSTGNLDLEEVVGAEFFFA